MRFVVDTFLTTTAVIEKYKIDSLEIKLYENLNYYFINKPKFLAQYEGTWDLSDDKDISYFIFKMRNGQSQKSRTLSIKIGDETVYFSKVRN